jgi:hypothetical protein
MTRTQDWAERLADYVEQCRDRPFEWGSHDCATMAVGAVAAMTGEVLWSPPYKNAAGAAKYMDGVSIADVVDGLLPRVPQGFAQRGDVVLMHLDGRDTLGVCMGCEIAAPGNFGLLMLPMSTAVAAWRV